MRIKRIEQGEPEVEITLAEALDEMTASYPPEQNARESIVSALNRGDEVVVNGVSYLGEDRNTDEDGNYRPHHSYNSFTIACVDCGKRCVTLATWLREAVENLTAYGWAPAPQKPALDSPPSARIMRCPECCDHDNATRVAPGRGL